MQILIVEDHLDVLDYLRSYLEGKGHDTLTASTADEAIAWLDRSSPDMAFVDLLLARGHGRQVIQEISKRGLSSRMVVITACDDLELRKELLAHGVTNYLFKPVTIRDLDLLLNPAPTADPSP